MSNTLKRIKNKIKSITDVISFSCRKKSKYLFVGSPSHGNLGDHAIAASSLRFLNDNSSHRFEEISFKDYYKYKNTLLKWRPKMIAIIGGGNMGDLWHREEDFHLDVIETFKKSKIIMLPQSIWFEDKSDKNKYLLMMKNIYNAHNDLHLFAREKHSYETMKNIFKNNHIYLEPDMVLTNQQSQHVCLNNKILVLKRMDKEGNKTSADLINNTIDFFKEKGFEIEYSDTVVDERVTSDTRDAFLKKIFDKISNSSLVITDRLHGMVFSFVNNTPVIVFSNSNLKVEGTYEWLKEEPSVMFSPSSAQLEDFI